MQLPSETGCADFTFAVYYALLRCLLNYCAAVSSTTLVGEMLCRNKQKGQKMHQQTQTGNKKKTLFLSHHNQYTNRDRESVMFQLLTWLKKNQLKPYFNIILRIPCTGLSKYFWFTDYLLVPKKVF